MAAPLTPKERLALDAAARAGGLIRGRSGFYAGFTTTGACHGPSTVHGLVTRGLLARPHGAPARRVVTAAGAAVLAGAPASPALPSPDEAARPRAYVD